MSYSTLRSLMSYHEYMIGPRIRMTTPVRLVLDALAHAGPDDPLWGYKLCELTGLGSGTILDRAESRCWSGRVGHYPIERLVR
jgi:hypothetical protein